MRHVARDARLRRTTDVQRVRRAGASQSDRLYRVSAIVTSESHARIAISVPARVGSAVRRNRARRRTRAAFAPLLQRVRPAADVLVSVRQAVVDAPFPDLERSAEALLRQLGVLGVRS
ncbi:MAG: ribonuclease P protein component [Chloroflexi bacterium 13_1_40CM_4_68_4]|nr:MAG: ribonuclease P protein component [Chloroflexi bacterium 13_1_40CM_4_68_4]